MSRTVLVIGGGGFVGGAILAALAGTPGIAARAGVRRRTALPEGVATVLCDALDPASLLRALDGVSCVVNAVLAAPAAMVRVTANICAAAAAQSDPPRIIHLSSMAVYGAATGLVDEASPLDAGGSAYAAAKIDSEAVIGRTVAGGRSAVILRPGIVYGPGGQQWIGRICRLLRARRLGDLGAAGDGYCNLIHAADVGAATLAALNAPAAGAYNLATKAPPRWNEVFLSLGLGIGAVPVPRIGARRLALESRMLAIPLQLAGRAGFAALPDVIPASLLRVFAQQIRLDPTRADTLRFARTGDACGLAESAAWFAGQHPK